MYTSTIVSLTITITIHGVIIYILYKIHLKNKAKHITSLRLEDIKTQLLYGSQSDLNKYFSSYFIEHKSVSNLYIGDKECIALLYHKEHINIDDILPIYKLYSPLHIVVLCIDCDKKCIDTIQKYSLDISIYNLLDSIDKYFLDTTPNFNISTKKHKVDIHYILSHILDRSRVKGYIFTSIFILLYTIYLPYKALYITISSILLLLAILSLFINTKNT